MDKKMLVTKEFVFHAAHHLTGDRLRENLHGHSYRVQVTVEGQVDRDDVVMDFRDLKKVTKDEAIDKLDHSNLNDLLEQPTAENITAWIWEKLENKLNLRGINLYEIKLWETATSFITYRGPKGDF